jgi:flagellar basal-body rod modification protein FlgD
MSISTSPVTSTPIGGTTSSAASTAASTAATLGGGLNETAFLKLMMTQLHNQDPLNPSSSDPNQFMAELAQLTSVEQQTNVAQSTSQLAAEQNAASALGLLGHTITYTDKTSGNPVTGTVQKVDFTASGPVLTVNGTTGVNPGSVTAVS